MTRTARFLLEDDCCGIARESVADSVAACSCFGTAARGDQDCRKNKAGETVDLRYERRSGAAKERVEQETLALAARVTLGGMLRAMASVPSNSAMRLSSAFARLRPQGMLAACGILVR